MMNKKSFLSYWMSLLFCALFLGVGTFNGLKTYQARVSGSSRSTSDKYSMTEEQKARKRRDLEDEIDYYEREYRQAERNYKNDTEAYEHMIEYNQSLARQGIKSGYYTDASIRYRKNCARSAYNRMQELRQKINSLRHELSRL